MEIAYHYTTLDSFLKMIEGSKKQSGDGKLKDFILWASSIYALNDPQEFLYGYNLLWNEELKSIEKKLHIKEDINRISEVWNEIEGHKTEQDCNKELIQTLFNSHDVPFVLSFSKAKDSLPMWNTYANKATGICLGFDNREFIINLDNIDDIKILNKLGAQDVDYGVIGDLAKKILTSFYKNYYKKIVSSEDASQKIFFKKQYLAISASTILAFIKHKAYEYENESRLIRFVLDDQKELIKYRSNTNGNIIPYIEVPIKAEYLNSIIVGPCANFEMVRREITAILQSVGIDNVKIEESEVPYRNY